MVSSNSGERKTGPVCSNSVGLSISADGNGHRLVVTDGGTRSVSNLVHDALVPGDDFRLFSANNHGGVFTGKNWPSWVRGLRWINWLPLKSSTDVTSQTSPVISDISQPETNPLFAITVGAPTGASDLLASTSEAVPLNSWTTNRPRNFNWFGNVVHIKRINHNDCNRFFINSMP